MVLVVEDLFLLLLELRDQIIQLVLYLVQLLLLIRQCDVLAGYLWIYTLFCVLPI